jgi:endoglycosylceramidase
MPQNDQPVAAPLGHAGRFLTDPHGRVVVLHGLNMVYKLPPYEPAASGFGSDDAAFLAEHGFNAVRLGVIYAAVEPAPGRYDDDYLASVAGTVRTLHRAGVGTLLDFHQDLYSERFQGEGFPDWAVAGHLPAVPRLGFPYDYIVMPALWRTFEHFWANDPAPGDDVGLQDRYAAAWRHVAAYFAVEPGVLGFDLLNEPFPGSVYPLCGLPLLGCRAFDKTRLTPFVRRVSAAIRESDPSRLICYEPNVAFNVGAPTHVSNGDAQAVFSFHNYPIVENLGARANLPQRPLARADKLEAEVVFCNAEAQAARTGDALLLSEFGSTDDLEFLRRMVALADEHMVSWLEWAYCGCHDPTGANPPAVQALVHDPAQPPTGANVEGAKLGVLARAYPRAIAGTPLRWSYSSGTGRFELAYSTRRAGGGALAPELATEIVLPRLHYSDGYRASADGGRVVSPDGAAVCEVLAEPGASEVSVRITPR